MTKLQRIYLSLVLTSNYGCIFSILVFDGLEKWIYVLAMTITFAIGIIGFVASE
jgi:lipoprotein signal peptidase